MPYCHKCGAKLEEDAKFCHICGTPVEAPTTMLVRRVGTPIYVPVVILVGILLVATFAFLAFLPVRSVYYNTTRQVPFEAGITDLYLNFTADVAQVNVNFERLTDKLVTMNVTADGAVGLLAPADFMNVTFDNTTVGSQLTVTSEVHKTGFLPILVSVTCDINIDPSITANLTITTVTGGITLNTTTGTTFSGLTLTATTGQIQANLGTNNTINGEVSLKTTTGAIDLSWNNENAMSTRAVGVQTTTGSININITQSNPLSSNVTANADATTGGITFTIAVHDNIGAKIQSTNTLGGISVDMTSFNGTPSQMQSTNYPAAANFNCTLKNTTGHININATYTP
jgi:hypothetical protein